MNYIKIRSTVVLIFALSIVSCVQKGKVTLVTKQDSPREKFAVEKLAGALKEQGYEVVLSDQLLTDGTKQIVVGSLQSKLLADVAKSNQSLDTLKKEGFVIESSGKQCMSVALIRVVFYMVAWNWLTG
jgi:biotin operon repressor